MCAQNYKMKVCCIGAGHVGGPMSSVIASKCSDILVTVVGKNSERIAQWNSDKLPIYEPRLDDIVKQCRNVNLYFSTDMETAIKEADLIFITVGTPTKNFGNGRGSAVDIKYVEQAARMIAKTAESNKIVVEKSNVPVRAAEHIALILSANQKPGIRYDILSNPEFLNEGSAINDLLYAERVLIGSETTPEGQKAVAKLSWIYEHWIPKQNILTMSTWSAELSKLATNAFLAQRVSSINALIAICEDLEIDVSEVAHVIGRDSRIGSKFLQTSVGFGNCYFEKDIHNLVYMCECLNLPEVAAYWRTVIQMNEFQKSRFSQIIVKSLLNTVSEKCISIYGIASQKHGHNILESPAWTVCKTLLEEGAQLHIYDKKLELVEIASLLTESCTKSRESITRNIKIHRDPYSAATKTHAIVFFTEWNEFLDLDYVRIYESMLKPAYIFDGSKILNHKKLQLIGFNVQTIGKQTRNFSN